MKRKYWLLDTVESIQSAFAGSQWHMWAAFADRDDCEIYDPQGVRLHEGVLQVNAGQWRTLDGYENEEWLAPLFVFTKHPCEGCHYPPHMCCLQPGDFRDGDEFDSYGYLKDSAPSDDDILSSDHYERAQQHKDTPPAGAVLVELDIDQLLKLGKGTKQP